MDEDVLTTALLMIKRGAGWPGSRTCVVDGPVLRELLKRGLLKRDGLLSRRKAYRLTDLGRERLVDVPGSGIRRSLPLPTGQ